VSSKRVAEWDSLCVGAIPQIWYVIHLAAQKVRILAKKNSN